MQRKQVKKEKKNFTTSLAGQWLRLCFPIQGVWVRTLVEKLRFYMTHSQKIKTLKKKKNRNNMVTEFNKDFKNAPRQKNSLKKGGRKTISEENCRGNKRVKICS